MKYFEQENIIFNQKVKFNYISFTIKGFLNMINEENSDSNTHRRLNTNYKNQSTIPYYRGYNNVRNSTNPSGGGQLNTNMNCLSSSYVPPNAQLPLANQQRLPATNGAAAVGSQRFGPHQNSNDFSSLAEPQESGQPRYIPSNFLSTNNAMSGGNNIIALPANPGCTRINSFPPSATQHQNNPANYSHPIIMHNNFTRLWLDQQNRLELERNSVLRRFVVLK